MYCMLRAIEPTTRYLDECPSQNQLQRRKRRRFVISPGCASVIPQVDHVTRPQKHSVGSVGHRGRVFIDGLLKAQSHGNFSFSATHSSSLLYVCVSVSRAVRQLLTLYVSSRIGRRSPHLRARVHSTPFEHVTAENKQRGRRDDTFTITTPAHHHRRTPRKDVVQS